MINIVSALCDNLLLWFWAALFAIFLLGSRKGVRTRVAGVAVLLMLWSLSTRPAAEALLGPLERRFSIPDVKALARQGRQTVVVLTGGGFQMKGDLLSSAFPHASMYRFVGGMEICARLGPDCEIVFSGTAGRSARDLPTAVHMERLATLLSPGRSVEAEALSGSTGEHPSNIKQFVGAEPFLLVTSAYHMTRSMRAFRKAGLDPIPYPVDFFVRGAYGWKDFLPSAESLWTTQVALREYLALVYYYIRGQ